MEEFKRVSFRKAFKSKDFVFLPNTNYKYVDGDNTTCEELKGKILVKQPNSPKGKNWFCMFDKEKNKDLYSIVDKSQI